MTTPSFYFSSSLIRFFAFGATLDLLKQSSELIFEPPVCVKELNRGFILRLWLLCTPFVRGTVTVVVFGLCCPRCVSSKFFAIESLLRSTYCNIPCSGTPSPLTSCLQDLYLRQRSHMVQLLLHVAPYWTTNTISLEVLLHIYSGKFKSAIDTKSFCEKAYLRAT